VLSFLSVYRSTLTLLFSPLRLIHSLHRWVHSSLSPHLPRHSKIMIQWKDSFLTSMSLLLFGVSLPSLLYSLPPHRLHHELSRYLCSPVCFESIPISCTDTKSRQLFCHLLTSDSSQALIQKYPFLTPRAPSLCWIDQYLHSLQELSPPLTEDSTFPHPSASPMRARFHLLHQGVTLFNTNSLSRLCVAHILPPPAPDSEEEVTKTLLKVLWTSLECR
jgi:hypothetical protein